MEFKCLRENSEIIVVHLFQKRARSIRVLKRRTTVVFLTQNGSASIETFGCSSVLTEVLTKVDSISTTALWAKWLKTGKCISGRVLLIVVFILISLFSCTTSVFNFRYLVDRKKSEADNYVQKCCWWHRKLAEFYRNSGTYDRKVEVGRMVFVFYKLLF